MPRNRARSPSPRWTPRPRRGCTTSSSADSAAVGGPPRVRAERTDRVRAAAEGPGERRDGLGEEDARHLFGTDHREEAPVADRFEDEPAVDGFSAGVFREVERDRLFERTSREV